MLGTSVTTADDAHTAARRNVDNDDGSYTDITAIFHACLTQHTSSAADGGTARDTRTNGDAAAGSSLLVGAVAGVLSVENETVSTYLAAHRSIHDYC